LCITEKFVQNLIKDIAETRKEEDKMAAAERNEGNWLYGQFIQDAIEILMAIVIPVDPKASISSYKEILNMDGQEDDLVKWLEPLMKTSQFVHFFNNEIDTVSLDLLTEIHQQTMLKNQHLLDHIVVLDKVPREEEKYPKTWIIN
jgi:hypothetical protein